MRKINTFGALETFIYTQKVDMKIILYAYLLIKAAFLHFCSGQTHFELLHEPAINKTAFEILNLRCHDFKLSFPQLVCDTKVLYYYSITFFSEIILNSIHNKTV